MKPYKQLEERLIRFFYKHDKSKLLLSKKIAKKFWRKEDIIMQHLEEKYGVSSAAPEKKGKKKKKKKDNAPKEITMDAPEQGNEEVKEEAQTVDENASEGSEQEEGKKD